MKRHLFRLAACVALGLLLLTSLPLLHDIVSYGLDSIKAWLGNVPLYLEEFP